LSVRQTARSLTFSPAAENIAGWDNSAQVAGSDNYAILHSIYHFSAIAGATYDVASISFFDPYVLLMYDQLGNAIQYNNEATDPQDFLLSDGYYSADMIYDWVAPYTGTYYVQAGWHQGEYYKFYFLSVNEDVSLSVRGTDWNDIFHIGIQNKTIDGSNGVDTIIFTGHLSNYTIVPFGTGFSIQDNFANDGTVVESNVEKLQFTDHTLVINSTPNEILLEAYRIYKAAFDRAPDYGGLGFWYHDMEQHGTSLTNVAEGFINSNEFRAMYGANPNNDTFVTLLYQHVLGRTPDQGGYDFWINDLKVENRAQVLTHFSESPENIASLAGVVSAGIIYEEYVL
jgi:serralysin